MQKSKVFMAAGAFVLSVAAVIATKASKKFGTGFNTAYFKNTTGVLITGKVSNATKLFTTTSTGNTTAYMEIYTSGNTSHVVGTVLELKTSGGVKQLYYH